MGRKIQIFITSSRKCKIINVSKSETPLNVEFAKNCQTIKVWTFWKTHKIWKNLPYGFDKSADLLSKRQNQIFSNCVCFSKSPNFIWWIANVANFMSLWWKLTCNNLQTTSASTSHDKVNHVNQKNSVKRQHSVNSNSSLTNFTAAAVLTKKPPSVITSPSSTGYETWNENLGKTMSLTKCAWPRLKRLSVSKVPNKWQ